MGHNNMTTKNRIVTVVMSYKISLCLYWENFQEKKKFDLFKLFKGEYQSCQVLK